MIHFDILNLSKMLKDLEAKTFEEDFWQDTKESQRVLKEIKVIKPKVTLYEKIQSEFNNLEELNMLLQEEEKAGNKDENLDLVKELLHNTNELEKELEKLEIETLFKGKYDMNNAIITLHAGAGGTEAQDWVEMLYRMYTN